MKKILTLLLFITINSYSQNMHIVYQDCSMIVITNNDKVATALNKSEDLLEYSPGWSTNYKSNVHMFWFAIENKKKILNLLKEL